MTTDRDQAGTDESTSEPRPPSGWPPIRYWVRVAVAVTAVVLVARVLAVLQNVMLIVVAGFVISLGLQPALAALERRGLRRGSAMATIILAGLVLMGGAAAAIVPTVISQAANAYERIPEFVDELSERSPMIGGFVEDFDLAEMNGDEGTAGLAGGLAIGVFNTVTLMLLIPYFAVSFPALKLRLFQLLRREHREDYIFVISRATELTSNYIMGNLIISLVAGVVTFIGLSLIGVPYALALSVWVAITDLIPAFGALIGAVPVLAVAGLSGTAEFVWALLLIVVYQQIENYVIAPRVMKKAVDLSPPVVIIALMIGATLAGIVGGLLALPIAALAKILFSEFVIRGRMEAVRAESDVTRPVRTRRFRTSATSRPLP
jgi:predicted PurR-regulated permease PerM